MHVKYEVSKVTTEVNVFCHRQTHIHILASYFHKNIVGIHLPSLFNVRYLILVIIC